MLNKVYALPRPLFELPPEVVRFIRAHLVYYFVLVKLKVFGPVTIFTRLSDELANFYVLINLVLAWKDWYTSVEQLT